MIANSNMLLQFMAPYGEAPECHYNIRPNLRGTRFSAPLSAKLVAVHSRCRALRADKHQRQVTLGLRGQMHFSKALVAGDPAALQIAAGSPRSLSAQITPPGD